MAYIQGVSTAVVTPIITKLEDIIKAEGFDHFGFSPFTKPLSLNLYEKWIESGLHAGMDYLKEHLDHKAEPQRWLPRAQSAIMVALNYLPHPEPVDLPIKSLKIARYARGADYHLFLKERLQALAEKLGQLFPEESFTVFTDSAPVMERDLGYRARLGWFGKNSCLIHPKKGSFFLLGEILTSLPLRGEGEPVADFCGTCRRCIDQCPTQAIRADRTLDAEKCISYLNIELKGLPPPAMIPKMGDWFFGCDICQEVCPWNHKAFGPLLKAPEPGRLEVLKDLKYILTSSNKGLEKAFAHSPLLRRRAFGLKRNALILAANLSARELHDEIEQVSRESEKLAPLALWVLDRFRTLPEA